MDYHRAGSLRVGLVGRDGHEMNSDLAVREKTSSKKRGIRDEKICWVEEKGQTLKRIRLSLG